MRRFFCQKWVRWNAVMVRVWRHFSLTPISVPIRWIFCQIWELGIAESLDFTVFFKMGNPSTFNCRYCDWCQVWGPVFPVITGFFGLFSDKYFNCGNRSTSDLFQIARKPSEIKALRAKPKISDLQTQWRKIIVILLTVTIINSFQKICNR